MDYITSTELRTKTPQLIKALQAGKIVKLLHRSKPVGMITENIVSVNANNSKNDKKFDGKQFMELVKKLPKIKFSDQELKENYREAMEKKHGKSLY